MSRLIEDLWKRFPVRQEPITTSDGKVVAEPLFWIEKNNQYLACFGDQLVAHERRLSVRGKEIALLKIGELV